MRRPLTVLPLIMAAGLAVAQMPPPSELPPTRRPTPVAAASPGRVVAHPRLSPLLNQLWASRFAPASVPPRPDLDHLLAADGAVRVVVECRPGERAAARGVTESLGGVVTAVHHDLVFATVPLGQLPLLASMDAVLRVRTSSRSEPHVVSEGLAAHVADVLHSEGSTGQGVKVGVLDCGGFTGYQALLGTDLPAQVTLWSGGSDPVGTGNHGTACAEIVYDMAPGAEMFLAYDSDEAEFYAAVDWLVTQGVDVISYSCGWLGPYPFDGRGLPHNPVNTAVAAARAAGVLWVSSSGNYGDGETYQAAYEQLPGYSWHSFSGDWCNYAYLYPGTSYYFSLTWNDWPADPATQGSTQDYDLELWFWDGATWQIPASSVNPQAGVAGQIPFEEIDFTPTVDGWYGITISQVNATTAHDLNLRSFEPGFTHWNADRSVAVPAESPDALAVGAAFWSDLGMEPFSSRGPTLGPGGTIAGGALKPDLAGADGNSGVTYGASNGTPWPTGTGFFGTSAACPHVAGGAALLRSKLPSLSTDGLESVLIGGATDLGDPGPDTGFGHGLMRLDSVLFADGVDGGSITAWTTAVP